MSMFWYLYLRGFQSSNFTGYCVILQVASCFVCEFLSSWSLWCFCLIMGTWSSCHCNIQTSAPARIIHLRMALLYAVTLLFGMITSKSQPRIIPWLPMRNPSTSEGPAASDKQESCAICSKFVMQLQCACPTMNLRREAARPESKGFIDVHENIKASCNFSLIGKRLR